MPAKDQKVRGEDVIDGAIAKAYEGVTSSEQWYAALDAFRAGVDATFFHWVEADPLGQRVTNSLVSHEAPEAKAREYNEHHAAGDLRLQAGLALQPGQFMLDHEHFDARTRSRHPIYAQWLPSVGLYHTLGMMLGREDTHLNFYAALREHRAPAFDEKARRFAQRVAPHLARAQGLRHRLVGLEVAASAGMAALDALGHAVWVVDAGSRVHQANRAAAVRMQSGAALDVRHGRLCMREPQAQAAWLAQLAGAMAGPHARAGGFVARSAAGLLKFTVLPLHADHTVTHSAPQALALLVLAPPAGADLLSAAQLESLLGLTPTEARLAVHLAQGRTIKDFAAIEGASWHTARTHLRNVLRKTGSKRQLEVVTLVRGLAG
ncbi:helix-turn-helix transcriptional regulator [Xenophilus arseniciresistens]|uniref:Helix-turn-helix transcriptional regulator n=1 Tax=Xenophilus arseniciresistens TaxID=1283306 RepID=A0AAE3N9W7_9BURK|nr:helix-turn-helix transcriptional regulator [Xenophilus arseniciresistens]MDA7418725.1 helix-turn-helix transcriptional regulator [Xenophilus arseniciresistens]